MDYLPGVDFCLVRDVLRSAILVGNSSVLPPKAASVAGFVDSDV